MKHILSIICILFTVNLTAQNCFDVGSSKSQVRSVMGTPTSVSSIGIWWYGSCSVDFDWRGDKVDGYENSCGKLKICGSTPSSSYSNNNSNRTTTSSYQSSSNADVGFNPFIGTTTSSVNFRTGPSTSNIILKSLSPRTQVYVYSRKTVNGYYKAIDIMSGSIGWVHKNYVSYVEAADVSYSGGFQSTGYTSSYNSDVKVRNKSSYTITLIIDNETFKISPRGSKSISVSPGQKYYIASAPGVIPSSGYQSFESNNGYEWEFWVSTGY